MIVTSMQITISSRRDIAVLQKESSALEGEEDVNVNLVNCNVNQEFKSDGAASGAAGGSAPGRPAPASR